MRFAFANVFLLCFTFSPNAHTSKMISHTSQPMHGINCTSINIHSPIDTGSLFAGAGAGATGATGAAGATGGVYTAAASAGASDSARRVPQEGQKPTLSSNSLLQLVHFFIVFSSSKKFDNINVAYFLTNVEYFFKIKTIKYKLETERDMAFDINFMHEAIKEAKKAAKKGECPIGAVIVKNGEIVSRGHNLRETKNCATHHAEILAIEKANKKLGAWRLEGCDLYVTLEPCIMCTGAIIQSRIANVYFGAFDKKAGAAGSVVDLYVPGLFNHNVNISGGIMKDECASLLSDFFSELRNRKKGK